MDKTVLCYIKKDDSYLLLYRNKKENDMNEGKYLGIGGHIEEGETKEEALIREVKEETGLDVLSYRFRGTLLFINDDYEEIMYLYTCDDFKGELIECDEGDLSFVKFDKMMTLPMWEGDKAFLPYLINDSLDYFELTLRYKHKELISVTRTK